MSYIGSADPSGDVAHRQGDYPRAGSTESLALYRAEEQVGIALSL
jgi:hypothetical protein